MLKQDYMLPEFRGSQLRPLVRYFVVAAVRHRPARRRISGFSQSLPVASLRSAKEACKINLRVIK